jgi:hypothetical protein
MKLTIVSARASYCVLAFLGALHCSVSVQAAEPSLAEAKDILGIVAKSAVPNTAEGDAPLVQDSKAPLFFRDGRYLGSSKPEGDSPWCVVMPRASLKSKASASQSSPEVSQIAKGRNLAGKEAQIKPGSFVLPFDGDRTFGGLICMNMAALKEGRDISILEVTQALGSKRFGFQVAKGKKMPDLSKMIAQSSNQADIAHLVTNLDKVNRKPAFGAITGVVEPSVSDRANSQRPDAPMGGEPSRIAAASAVDAGAARLDAGKP